MFPLVVIVPQFPEQALPVRLQFTLVSEVPEPVTCAVNDCVAPVVTEALAGEIAT